MYTHQSQDIPILTTHQRNRKHHRRFPLKGFPKVRPDTDKNLNQILPQQTASLFQIKQPPRSVIYWISLLAAASTLPPASPKPLQPSSLENGKGGAHSSNTHESQTNSWKESHKRRKQSWCNHSPPQCNETSLEKRGNIYSSTELSSTPYWMYLRPFRRTFRTARP